MKKLLLPLILFVGLVSRGQSCPDLVSPLSGETNVAVDVTIDWEESPGVPDYRIRLGTTPGGNQILETSVGSATAYTPPLGLPENTQIFVTIILSFPFQNDEDIICPSQSFITEDVTTVPPCNSLQVPNDGATDVSVFSSVSWNYASTATSYDITLGTAPGQDDIASENVQGLSYDPPGELPPDTVIYVNIVPRNENGPANNCNEFSFRTGEVAPLPDCTSLLSPLNGDVNVPLTPLLEWEPVVGAVGYRVTIGTTPTNADILENGIFLTTSTFVIDFEPNRTFFIRIVPFNENGEDAIGCVQETFSTIVGCGPYLDPTTGEFVSFDPEIIMENTFSLCENLGPLTLNAPTGADGYRWGRINEMGNAFIILEGQEITLDRPGNYFLEAYNVISSSGSTLECPTILEFSVNSSGIASIDNIDSRDSALGMEITVQVSGLGDYEYAIDNIDGPYQSSNVFRDITPGTYTIFVRDRNGCGIAQETFEQDLTVEGFPKFFTPNGDNINDFWQFIQPLEGELVALRSIEIYDQYGKLIRQIDQNGQGWDGTLNGRPLPAGGYWFRAVGEDGDVVRGNFTLKR